MYIAAPTQYDIVVEFLISAMIAMIGGAIFIRKLKGLTDMQRVVSWFVLFVLCMGSALTAAVVLRN
jgi:hypothetical protein